MKRKKQWPNSIAHIFHRGWRFATIAKELRSAHEALTRVLNFDSDLGKPIATKITKLRDSVVGYEQLAYAFKDADVRRLEREPVERRKPVKRRKRVTRHGKHGRARMRPETKG